MLGGLGGAIGGMFGGGKQQQQQSYGPTNQQQPQGITYGEPAPGSAGAGSFGQQTQQPQIDQPQQQQPQQQLSREDYRDKWMSSGVKDQAGLTNFLNQYGGTQLSGNGTVKTPYGDDVIDMLIGARSGGNGMPGWTGLPGQSASSVTPWNGQQQQGGGGSGNGGFAGGYGGGQQNQQWLQQLIQQMQRQNPQNMPYHAGNPDRNMPQSVGQGPISNYWQQMNQQGAQQGTGGDFTPTAQQGGPGGQTMPWNPNMQYHTTQSPQGNEWYNGGGLGRGIQSPYAPQGQNNPNMDYGGGPSMVSNGWGGWKKYDPNFTGVS